MAKSKSFFGLRKGSTKTMTYSVLKGQQITKDRVTDIANPRTMDQTVQRIPFAQAVKFYKQATRGLFRFAFEDKKPLESDYNAFMRHNVKYASSVSLDNYRDNKYPAIGNWLLAQGSIPPADVQVTSFSLSLDIAHTDEAVSTVGGVSELILSRYPNLAEGDIVTFVSFISYLQADGSYASLLSPDMEVVQFIIDINSETTLESIGLESVTANSSKLLMDGMPNLTAGAGAVIFSRNTPSGLKTSDAQLIPNTIWNNIMTAKESYQQIQGDAYSWGATEKAILQGAVAGETSIV